MTEKPTYHQLKERVKELEEKCSELKHSKKIPSPPSAGYSSSSEKTQPPEGPSGDSFDSAIINKLPGVYYLIDRKGKMHRWNEKVERITGYNSKELASMLATDFFKKLDLPELEAAITQVFETGKASLEMDLLTRSGDPIPHFFTASLIEIGGDVFCHGTAFDITDRKRIENKLKQRGAFLNQLLDSIQDGINILNKDLTIQYTNRVLEKWYSENLPLIGKKCYACYHNADQPCTPCPSLRCLETGQPEFNEVPGLPGSPVEWLELYSYPMIDPEQSEVTGVIEIARDITKRKNIEKAVVKAKEDWENTFDAIPDIVTIQDNEMRITRANKAAHDFFQVNSGALNGQVCYEIFMNYSEPCPGCPILLTIEDHSPHDLNITSKNLGKVFNVTSSCLLDERGELKCLVHSAKDITEHKKLEAQLLQEQKLTSVGTLAGGIAHDFNNILTVLFGNIELARSELSSDHPAFGFLEKSEKSMNRAKRLTSQLLTFAKGGSPVKKDVNLGRLVEDTVRFDLSGNGIKPVFTIADDLWQAHVDKGQMQQVISNLVSNADQAVPEGGHLYITMENAEISETEIPQLEPGRYLKITVQDEGTGIDRKHLDQIFDPYFSTKQAGMGLGLATVFSIIKKHGGHIRVDSELGQGTSFTLYIPASHSKSRVEAKPSEAWHQALPERAQVLVMDDEKMVCDVVEKILTRYGFIVEKAAHGREAIEKYKQSMAAGDTFDVVIMDLSIPGGMGGKETIQELLQIDPGARVIISSGYSDDPVIANYKEFGFQDAIKKPFQMKALLELIAKVRRG